MEVSLGHNSPGGSKFLEKVFAIVFFLLSTVKHKLRNLWRLLSRAVSACTFFSGKISSYLRNKSGFRVCLSVCEWLKSNSLDPGARILTVFNFSFSTNIYLFFPTSALHRCTCGDRDSTVAKIFVGFFWCLF